MKNLNEYEQAAICLYLVTGCRDRKILFQIAEGENRVNKLKPTSLNTIVNNWFNSHKIQEGIKYFTALRDQEREQIRQEAIKGLETETPNGGTIQPRKGDINFLDLEQFLKYANEQANQIKDDKERRAWVEMIGKYMAFKDGSSEGVNEIQRFYTPVTCENCEIYAKCKACTFSNCPNLL